ncbi:hypothetical protein PG984_016193 [Apiospora sp. TS-2023a]
MNEQERPNRAQRLIRRARRMTRNLFGGRNGSTTISHASERDSSPGSKEQLNTATTEPDTGDTESAIEEVHKDDICPVCQLLLHGPVTTTCNHTLCRFCMATWAFASQNEAPIVHVDVDTDPAVFDVVAAMQARCPMCRTFTTALPSLEKRDELKAKYPRTYMAREAEVLSEAQGDGAGNEETITLYIGNEHQDLPVPTTGEPVENRHGWTVFVRPSRTDIIEEVHFYLQPTFRDTHIVRPEPPYQITRRGRRPFVVLISVILRPDFLWLSGDVADAPDGAFRGALGLEWELDFDRFGGRGSMNRIALKVKNDRNTVDREVPALAGEYMPSKVSCRRSTLAGLSTMALLPALWLLILNILHTLLHALLLVLLLVLLFVLLHNYLDGAVFGLGRCGDRVLLGSPHMRIRA